MAEVVEMGVIAARVLREGANGKVAAVFERSFYLQSGDDFVCVGGRALGRGALNVVLDGPLPRVALDASFAMHGAHLLIGKGPAMGMANAVIWHPPAPQFASAAAHRSALDQFMTRARFRAPTEGLARFVLAPDDALDGPLARAACRAIGTLQRYLLQCAGNVPPTTPQLSSWASRSAYFATTCPATIPPIAQSRVGGAMGPRDKPWDDSVERMRHIDLASAVGALIGLGPGLTPSGDDLIGGLLIALAALGEPHLEFPTFPNVMAAQAATQAHRNLIEREAKPVGTLQGRGEIHTRTEGDLGDRRSSPRTSIRGGHDEQLKELGQRTMALRRCIWSATEPLLATHTTALSAAHLRAAAEGLGGATIHAVLGDLLAGRGDRLDSHLDAIDQIGHCSGWDALAGMLLALHCARAVDEAH